MLYFPLIRIDDRQGLQIAAPQCVLGFIGGFRRFLRFVFRRVCRLLRRFFLWRIFIRWIFLRRMFLRRIVRGLFRRIIEEIIGGGRFFRPFVGGWRFEIEQRQFYEDMGAFAALPIGLQIDSDNIILVASAAFHIRIGKAVFALAGCLVYDIRVFAVISYQAIGDAFLPPLECYHRQPVRVQFYIDPFDRFGRAPAIRYLPFADFVPFGENLRHAIFARGIFIGEYGPMLLFQRPTVDHLLDDSGGAEEIGRAPAGIHRAEECPHDLGGLSAAGGSVPQRMLVGIF